LGIRSPQQQWYFTINVKSNLEFYNNFFDCPSGNQNDPACTPYSGNFIMDQLGIPRDYVTTGCLALCGFVVFYILTTVLILQFLPVHMTFTKQIKRTEQETGAAEAVARAKTAEQRPAEVAIRIQDLRLWINKQGIRKRSLVHILQGVSANFEPGKLNVIMGPSGTALPSAL
jgi:hypothetical protein